MDLIDKTPAQKIADEISTISSELIKHAVNELKRINVLANTPGEQQNIMNVFGTKATMAFMVYVAFFKAVSAALQEHDVPAPSPDVFQAQPDGTILYVAPVPVEEPAN